MTGWLAAFILAQALDTTTTCIGFARGGHELNPIMPSTCSRLVPVKAGVTLALGTVAYKTRSKKLLVFGTLLTGAVVANNLYQLSK